MADQGGRKGRPRSGQDGPESTGRCLYDTQREVAAELGVSLGTMRGWIERGLDTRVGEKHCLAKTAKWIIERQRLQLEEKTQARRSSGADAVDGDGTILDYKRRLESKKLELQLLEAEKQVISVQHVRDFLILVASRVKDLGNTLQSQYGRDALLCLNEAVADLEQTVKRWEDGLRESEFEL